MPSLNAPTRRRLLATATALPLVSLLGAPAIVRASSLMTVITALPVLPVSLIYHRAIIIEWDDDVGLIGFRSEDGYPLPPGWGAKFRTDDTAALIDDRAV